MNVELRHGNSCASESAISGEHHRLNRLIQAGHSAFLQIPTGLISIAPNQISSLSLL